MTEVEFRPSSAGRWSTCTASVKATAGLSSPGSKHADRGTVAHWVLERCLRDPAHKPYHFAGQQHPQYPGIEVDDEMCHAIEETLDYIAGLARAYGQLYIEPEVRCPIDLSGGHPMSGTSDVLLLDWSHVLHVCDLKYGKGVRVDARKNRQLTLYALGAVQELGRMGQQVAGVQLHIMQPRINHYDRWEMTLDELQAEAREMQAAMREALSDTPAYRPSEEACRWCPIKGSCKARAEEMYAKVAPQFGFEEQAGEVKPRPTAELSDAQLSFVGFDLPAVRDWCSAVEARIRELVESAPERMPGWKLVAGRTSRAWRDEQAALASFKAAGLDRKQYVKESILSPAQAEKAAGKEVYLKHIEPAVETRTGTPALVPASDKRPSLNTTADKFGLNTPEKTDA